ncbi:Eukaryotic/viral aspartic protease [Phytophthora megakarya]|uniref:Eukaryotic/viral aspartic protease n=1 Tax=Phytophthora megakarya TaxID=4795 RepID=A0A225UGQ3_9STRA|nr:Eukaryotic/viral aspartic protease [Phytophthora megakarya]
MQLERDPILSFIKPKLIGELTGPFHEPDFSKLRNVRLTIQALFAILRESGFVLGAFEMERVYDWNLESWMNAIYAILDPLTVLVGTIGRATTTTQDRKPKTRPALPPPEYASNEDSGVESPKRMPMRRPPRVMQLAATPAEPGGAVHRRTHPQGSGRRDRTTNAVDEDANCTRDDAFGSALREPDAHVPPHYDGNGPSRVNGRGDGVGELALVVTL